MLPEISRRCRSCGAAVRAGARFCPQCGQNMEAAPVDSARDDDGAGSAILDSEPAQEEWAPPTREFSAFVGSLDGGAARRGAEAAPEGDVPHEARVAADDSREVRQTLVEAPAAETQAVEAPAFKATAVEVPAVEAPAVEAPAVEASANRLPVAAADAGGAEGTQDEEARGRVTRVREGTRARVGKMREEALVVLEEAPDDSGLRFVLAAAALFAVFLLILVLSTTILR